MCNNQKENCCISEVLTVINILQQNAECSDACLDSCDRGFLGCAATTIQCNTRPVMLYTCGSNGTPWSMPTTKENIDCNAPGASCSSVFRVEKIDGCCATFRVLAANPNTAECAVVPYVSTNSFFTMNLDCCCAIKCLQDTFIDSCL